jgi:hypothetical protein
MPVERRSLGSRRACDLVKAEEIGGKPTNPDMKVEKLQKALFNLFVRNDA